MHSTLKTAAAALLTITAIAATTGTAEAARYRFGADESLHAYAKTGMTHEKKPVSLCYKASTYNVFAPVYTTDEMVLCDEKKKLYWPVPTGERLNKLQALGLMPKPLPAYERPTLDYVVGYSLWIALAGFGAFSLGASMMGRKKDNASESAMTGDEQTA